MKRRLLIIALAVILAAAGTGGVIAYVKGANARAIAGMRAVSVLVAQKKIPSGTPAGGALRGGMLASQRLPASSVPASALHFLTPAQLSLVLSAPLQPGQLLLRQMLIPPVHLTGGLAIPPGMVAVSASFCLTEAVAGDIQPGSKVAIFDTVVPGGAGGTAGPACSGTHSQQGGGARTRLVLPGELVLSVGAAQPGGSDPSATSLSTASSSASGQGAVTLTLALTQPEAEKLIQITETGLPYLALVTTSSHTTADYGRLLEARPAPRPRVITVAPAPPPSPAPAPTPSPSPTRKNR